ncbi:phage repressor protein CI [Erwinia sp. S59]|uniref:phage repressor protein CI n=1 Tax=Erwinia sp. S59 TaxID=2769340 RepID=UPI001909F37C|nr:phage repressor protein CI [Erwinia sp. S59]MBK0089430.1 phage repressor protein CI [Erwinia sp. S59]
MNLQIDFENGAKEVLDRVIEAYGFSTKIALADHLGIASSSLANRYTRGNFPADIVVKCMAETGATLEWLATGTGSCKGDSLNVNAEASVNLVRKSLSAGGLQDLDTVVVGKAFLTHFNVQISEPVIIVEGLTQYVADFGKRDIFDGLWLIGIEGSYSIKKVSRLPGLRLKIASRAESFECAHSDIEIVAYLPISCGLTDSTSL